MLCEYFWIEAVSAEKYLIYIAGPCVPFNVEEFVIVHSLHGAPKMDTFELSCM
jgi:hypothetical protein